METMRDPWIIHYAAVPKPWDDPDTPHAGAFLSLMEKVKNRLEQISAPDALMPVP